MSDRGLAINGENLLFIELLRRFSKQVEREGGAGEWAGTAAFEEREKAKAAV